MFSDALCRRFIKDSDNVGDPKVRLAYGRLAGIVGIVCNLLLCGFKLLAGILAGSLAMIADAFNNLSDAGSAIVTLIGFKLAGAPPDKDHPFGHGRMEYLSAMGVAVLIILAGFELATSAIDKMIHPASPSFSLISTIILAVSILVKLWMAVFNRRIGKKIRSDALCATGLDSRNDVICTGVVLISSVLGLWLPISIDGYVGMAVALFVIWSGFTVIRDTVSPLMGQAPDPELVQNIQQLVLSHEGVVGIHDLIVHDYGPGRRFISLHAEVSADGDMLELHDVIDTAERELSEEMGCLATIHMDPLEQNDSLTTETRERVAMIVRLIDPSITIHDFRMVSGPTHTNVIFDAVVPHSCPLSDRELIDRITDGVRALDGNYFAVVKIDKSFI